MSKEKLTEDLLKQILREIRELDSKVDLLTKDIKALKKKQEEKNE